VAFTDFVEIPATVAVSKPADLMKLLRFCFSIFPLKFLFLLKFYLTNAVAKTNYKPMKTMQNRNFFIKSFSLGINQKSQFLLLGKNLYYRIQPLAGENC